MKLITRFTLWYIAITAVVLVIGGVILFKTILFEVDREAEVKLKVWVRMTARQIEEGIPLDQLRGVNNISIEEMDFNSPLIPYQKTDSMGLFAPKLFGLDRKLTISQSFKIGGKHYYISTYNFITEPDEVIEGLEKSLAAIFILLLVFISVASLLISGTILSPFRKTLQAIKTFTVKQPEPVKAFKTNTDEFKQLNIFLERMTAKALEDYRTLKEFSENASHEIRTPLSVIRGKLELLTSTPINEEQAAYIYSAHNAVDKLSAVNQSLILLAKLENQEYQTSEKINFSEVTKNAASAFQELIDMKSLVLSSTIHEDVYVQINPYLADILLNNLLSNAIRHNVKGGTIALSLTRKSLAFENTGNPPEAPPEEFFKRFKKSNQSSDSTGLGLSIVKQICDVSGFGISYTYEDHLHKTKIIFG